MFITVAASSNPYGVFSLEGSINQRVDENVGVLQFAVTRKKGLIGRVLLTYVLKSDNMDFTSSQDITPTKGGSLFNMYYINFFNCFMASVNFFLHLYSSKENYLLAIA